MAIQTPVLTKTYSADAAVPRKNLCLVMSGVNAGNVAAPAAAGATKFVGVSAEVSDVANKLSVHVEGIVQIETDGSAIITAGDYLTIANATGQVKTQAPGFGGATVTQLVGLAQNSVAATAGLFVDVLLQPMLHKP